LPGFAGSGEIGPGGHDRSSSGEGDAALTEGDQQGNGQATARRIADDSNVFWGDVLLQQPLIGADGIFKSGGVGVFGSKAVINDQSTRLIRLSASYPLVALVVAQAAL